MKEQYTSFRPIDSNRINVNEQQELNYWKKELSASKESLLSAIKNVGNSTSAVRRHLKINSGQNGLNS